MLWPRKVLCNPINEDADPGYSAFLRVDKSPRPPSLGQPEATLRLIISLSDTSGRRFDVQNRWRTLAWPAARVSNGAEEVVQALGSMLRTPRAGMIAQTNQ
jgi:hypothetical protein